MNISYNSIGEGIMKTKNMLKLIFGFALIANLVNAQNFNDALRLTDDGIITSARSLGMGNAAISIPNDLSMAQLNPAGLALLKKGELNVGVNYNSFSNESNFFNNSLKQSLGSTNWNQIGFVAPFPTSRGSFAIAIGYNQLKDFNRTLSFDGFNPGSNSMIQDLANFNDDLAFKLALSYPLYDKNNKYLYDTTVVNGKLNQRGDVSQKGGINSWFLSGALEIEKDVFFGATLNLISGTFDKTRNYMEEDTKNNYPSSVLLDPIEPLSANFLSFSTTDRLNWEISGWDLKLGLIAKIDEKLSAGFTIHIPRVYTIKESYQVTGESLFGTGKRWTYDSGISKIQYDVSTPYEYAVGLSYQEKNYTLSANAKFVDYTTLVFSSGFATATRNNKNRDIQALFRAVISLNAGGEYVIPNTGLALRAGFMYMPSPFKDDPTEYDKKYITGGLGYNLSPTVQLNAGLAYGWWKDFGDNYGSGVSRTFQSISVTNLIVSLKYIL